MKKILAILLILLVASCDQQNKSEKEHKHNENVEATEAKPKKKPLSPHTSTMATIGDTHIHIDYSSPGVRGRIIFGGLLPYDMVWQAGAHMATWVETSKDLTIDGKVLPTGKYGFFTIPSKDEWTLIFNSNWDQHGKDEYDQKDDVLRFKVKPSTMENSVEHLEYAIEAINDTHGIFSLAWETVKVSFEFSSN